METAEALKSLRQKIDSLDREILRLLNERAGIVREVGRVKSKFQISPYNPQREEEIVQTLKALNPGPFPGEAIASVFREIISACRSLEGELTVAYLGPPATHPHRACIERFGNSLNALPQENIEEVFEAV
ncbi:MAG: chorismate mutase, partial [Deltaproteobacteria bacterium]|nr:chorismate mutase [Deltaproteobacteria bacterium]